MAINLGQSWINGWIRMRVYLQQIDESGVIGWLIKSINLFPLPLRRWQGKCTTRRAVRLADPEGPPSAARGVVGLPFAVTWHGADLPLGKVAVQTIPWVFLLRDGEPCPLSSWIWFAVYRR